MDAGDQIREKTKRSKRDVWSRVGTEHADIVPDQETPGATFLKLLFKQPALNSLSEKHREHEHDAVAKQRS